MTPSRAVTIDGVPTFETTAGCERFVAECNTRSNALRTEAKTLKAQARNAANQMRALVLGQTLDDVTQPKLFGKDGALTDAAGAKGSPVAVNLGGKPVVLGANQPPHEKVPRIDSPHFIIGWYSRGIGASAHYIGDTDCKPLCGADVFDPLPRYCVPAINATEYYDDLCEKCFVALHPEHKPKPKRKRKARKTTAKKTSKTTARKSAKANAK